MANVYVRSGAGGAGTGADWTNAYTTLGAALTAKSAGDDFWVSEDHAETAASAKTLTSPGSAATPCRVFCVNHAGSVPPVSADLRTTATITTTGANSISIQGFFSIIYGIIFSAGDSSASANITMAASNSAGMSFKNCALRLGGSTAGNQIIFSSGASNVYMRLDNTTMQFAATGHSIKIGTNFIWRNTASAITGATFPTTFFKPANGFSGNVVFEGVDLSALGSGVTLVGSATGNGGSVLFKDCKLGASVTVAAAPGGPSSMPIIVARSDSADTSYRSEKYDYLGTETTETTIILTSGASDGTTGLAKKIVTTANAKPLLPFEAIPISFWNETTSSITVTLQGIWGGGAVPNNNDIWAEFEYLGTSGVPLGAFATCGLADPLATAAGLAAGSGTWGGSTTKFKLAATFTPQEKGPITIYVKAGAASSTFYVDPKPVVT
jgi:hypothetical protein